MTQDPRALLRQLYDAAVASALPGHVLAGHLPEPEENGVSYLKLPLNLL